MQAIYRWRQQDRGEVNKILYIKITLYNIEIYAEYQRYKYYNCGYFTGYFGVKVDIMITILPTY